MSKISALPTPAWFDGVTQENKDFFEEYLGYWSRGLSTYRIARLMGYRLETAAENLEILDKSLYVQYRQRQILTNMSSAEFWPRNRSLLVFASIAEDESQMTKSRIAAVAQINAMLGYVKEQEDPNKGKSKSTLLEFAKKAGLELDE